MRRPGPAPVLLLALLAAGCLPEGAGRPGLPAYNLDENGLALRGYSPVSYFQSGRPERGSPEHALTWRGVTYRFTSAAQKDAFAADPARYEPVCGGWCAYGISLGIRWDADPEAFKIVDGRLLLFSRKDEADARELWEREEDERALLDRVDRYWRSLLDGE